MLAVGRAKGRAQPQRAARVLLRAGRAVAAAGAPREPRRGGAAGRDGGAVLRRDAERAGPPPGDRASAGAGADPGPGGPHQARGGGAAYGQVPAEQGKGRQGRRLSFHHLVLVI